MKIFGGATHLRKRWRGWKENTGMHQNPPTPAPEATAFNRETYPASFCNLFKEILSFRGWLPENTHGTLGQKHDIGKPSGTHLFLRGFSV